MKEKAVAIFYSRPGVSSMVMVDTEDQSNKKRFHQIVKGLNQGFQASGNHDAFIMMDGVVYRVNPSLKYKKITGEDAKKIKRQVKNAAFTNPA